MTTVPNIKPEELYRRVMKTYEEQSEGWKKRGLFERQWITRDFKRSTGMSIDEMRNELQNLGDTLNSNASQATSVGSTEENRGLL
jgi:hypothetical protein